MQASTDEAEDIDGEKLRQEARGWVARLSAGDATVADRDAVQAWRGRSLAHEAAFRETARLWRRLGPAAALATDPAQAGAAGQSPAASLRPRAIGRRAFAGAAALAAAVLGAVVIGPALALWPAPAMLLADHRTAIGEQREIALDDGSFVLLDAGGAFTVDFEPGRRHITLLAGEALFTVAPDAARPFVVTAGHGSVTAVGTVFTVRNIEATQQVECLEGAVSVAAGRAGEPIVLRAGQAVAYGEGGPLLPEIIDPYSAAPWRDGLLVFRDQTLDQVVAELNRYRPGRIAILSDATAQRRVTGIFHLSRPDEALDHLRRTLSLETTELGERYILLH